MKINKFIPFILFIGFVFGISIIQSCGSKSSDTSTSGSNTETTAVVDTKAHSDSKGVGKFTSVELTAPDPARIESGKAIFNTKCATCHKLTDVKFVGPGLLGVTKRRTPEWILNMITNPTEMVKSDAVAKKLLEEHLTPMANQNIADDDAKSLLDFLRQNDSK